MAYPLRNRTELVSVFFFATLFSLSISALQGKEKNPLPDLGRIEIFLSFFPKAQFFFQEYMS
jgi:hypothetical protein